MPLTYKSLFAVAVLVMGLALACDFNPTSSFDGFDGMGSRISGQFSSTNSGASGLAAAPQSTFDNMTVHVKQNTSIETTVRSNGTFTLEGIPEGRVTLVFKQNIRILSEIHIDDVLPNQEIRIVVELTVDLRVILISQDGDDVDFSVSCAKSPSFWCRASRGNSGALSQMEFFELAAEAASMLSGIPELETAEGVADGVCRKRNERDRFFRELAALALNLAAGLDRNEPLVGEEFATIGDAFDRAVEIARGNPSPGQIDKFHELIEHINDNENTAIPGCDDNSSDDDSKTKSNDSNSSGSSSGSSSSG